MSRLVHPTEKMIEPVLIHITEIFLMLFYVSTHCIDRLYYLSRCIMIIILIFRMMYLMPYIFG